MSCFSTPVGSSAGELTPPRLPNGITRPSTPRTHVLKVAFNSSSELQQGRPTPVRDAKFYRQLEKAKDEREASINKRRANHPQLRTQFEYQPPAPCSTPPSPSSSVSSSSSEQSFVSARKKLMRRKRSEPILRGQSVFAVSQPEAIPPVPEIPAIYLDVDKGGPWEQFVEVWEQSIRVVQARLVQC